MLPSRMPPAQITPQPVVMAGGLDLVTPATLSKPGTARVAFNYEASYGGGYERVGGIERFDGQFAPNQASYTLLQCAAAISPLLIGQTLTGATSAATGVVLWVGDTRVALGRVTGTFGLEVLNQGATPVGTVTSTTPTVDGFLDNLLYALAATNRRIDIGKVPGSGRIRGLHVLNNTVYAWRNTVDQLAMAIYKATPTGWQAVTLHHELAFTAGTSEYTEGETITQGGTSATVLRVALQSGTWSGGTAAGRLIITAPTGGVFSGGAAAGGGACTLSGASTQITLAPDGIVRADAATLTASISDKRLYGCDGVNREFEFGNDILVPLNTGMGSARATTARVHKNYVFFGYRGSLQHAAVGQPYVWSAVVGAGELGTGDVITNLISVGGSEAAAALMVLCQNALLVLYGNGPSSWNLVPLSRISGARAGGAQDIGGAVALDEPGVARYPATQSFGNFAWDLVSRNIEPISRGTDCECSTFVTTRSKFRIFLKDGTVLSGLPVSRNEFQWTTVDYGRLITAVDHNEINGVARTFYGDSEGWVYEADVGRSFAGESIVAVLRLNELNQRTPLVVKQYHWGQIEAEAASAFTLSFNAEFMDGENPSTDLDPASLASYGAGLTWDLTNWDESYWDVPGVARKRAKLKGQGSSVAITMGVDSDNELPHKINAITVTYTQRRLARA